MDKRALIKVGEAAIAVRMTGQQIADDPVKAMTIAMDAMRATLGLPKPQAPAISEEG
jgi:hypothetical protein